MRRLDTKNMQTQIVGIYLFVKIADIDLYLVSSKN